MTEPIPSVPILRIYWHILDKESSRKQQKELSERHDSARSRQKRNVNPRDWHRSRKTAVQHCWPPVQSTTEATFQLPLRLCYKYQLACFDTDSQSQGRPRLFSIREVSILSSQKWYAWDRLARETIDSWFKSHLIPFIWNQQRWKSFDQLESCKKFQEFFLSFLLLSSLLSSARFNEKCGDILMNTLSAGYPPKTASGQAQIAASTTLSTAPPWQWYNNAGGMFYTYPESICTPFASHDDSSPTSKCRSFSLYAVERWNSREEGSSFVLLPVWRRGTNWSWR